MYQMVQRTQKRTAPMPYVVISNNQSVMIIELIIILFLVIFGLGLSYFNLCFETQLIFFLSSSTFGALSTGPLS